MKFKKANIIFLFLGIQIFTISCINPFAPELDENIGNESSLISDLKTIDGIFNNMQYAYTFKDTTIYGELLNPNFTFTFRNYETEVDEAWGRELEMRTTYGLFNNVERLDLIWNRIVSITADSTNVTRSFNLTVTYNPMDIEYVEGKVNLQLAKSAENKWQIITWIDESNF